MATALIQLCKNALLQPHRYEDNNDSARKCPCRDEHVVQVVKVDGYGHLHFKLALSVARQSCGDRF